MKWARTFLAIGYTTDHANITRMLPDLQKPCKRTAMPACKTAPNPAEGKARRRVGKEKQPKTGKENKEREFHAVVGQERSYHEQMRLTAEGRTRFM